MKLSVDVIKINRFDSFSEFTHASSPRYFKNHLGKIEQYDFTKKDDLQKYNIHMIQFMKMVQVEKKIPYLLNQVHSDQIFVLKDVSQTHEQIARVKADAIITHLPEIPIGIFTADCIPILIYEKYNKIIGCIHAGWKGALNGVIKNTLKKFKDLNSGFVGICIVQLA